MNSYEGEEAYVVISLINPQGAYEKTLYVLGPDKQWYKTLKDWHKFQTKSKEKLSAITGASVSGGDRAMKTIEIEDQKYHTTDAEIPLTTTALAELAVGNGYIRFFKLSKVQ